MSSNTNISLNITKDKGITHALKAYVQEQKDMEISGGTIDAKEWDATLDKLAQIQKNRQEKNEASIFRGGSEKADWHKNMVVDEGKIDFSQEEINELLSTMGVTLKKKAQEPDDKAKPSPDENKNQPPKKDSPIIPTKTPSVKTIGGFPTKIDPHAQNNNVTKNPDGTYSLDTHGAGFDKTTGTYSVDGNLTQYSKTQADVTTTTKLDETFRKSSEIIQQGDKQNIIEYTYSGASRNPIKSQKSAGDTKISETVYVYDQNGKKTEETETNFLKNQTIKRKYTANGEFIETITDSDNNRIISNLERKNGSKVKTSFEYNEDGMKSKLTEQIDGQPTTEYNFKYDRDNKIKSIKRSVNGNNNTDIDYSYNATSGNLEEIKSENNTYSVSNGKINKIMMGNLPISVIDDNTIGYGPKCKFIKNGNDIQIVLIYDNGRSSEPRTLNPINDKDLLAKYQKSQSLLIEGNHYLNLLN